MKDCHVRGVDLDLHSYDELRAIQKKGIDIIPQILEPKERVFSYYNYYNNVVNWGHLTVPPTSNKYCWLTDLRVNKPMYYPRNIYMINSMIAVGGGAEAQLKRAFRYRRVGGSTQDLLNYMGSYQDNSNLSYVYKISFSELDSRLHIVDKVAFPPLPEALSLAKFNYTASPGTLLKNLGFKTKQDHLVSDVFAYNIIYTNWCLNPSSPIKPKEVWSVASRPKLKEMSKLVEGMDSFKPCSRAISYCSTLEQLIGLPLWLPVSMMLERRFKETMCGIAIGINRLGADWMRLGSTFAESKCIYVGDFSKYDQSIPKSLMVRAFDYIFNMFDKSTFSDNYISNFKDWMMENIIHKDYLLQNKIMMRVENGVPSGSLWTSLLNSICNFIIITETMYELGIDQYTPVVYGDDHIIILYQDTDYSEFKDKFLSAVKRNFGVTGKEEEATLSTPSEYYVTYERPVYDKRLDFSKGTNHLKAKYTQQSTEPFESWDHNKGTTHRWQYCFSNRVKFLQYYFLRNGCCIRPWSESLIRLVNCEQEVKTPEEHEILLISHLIDNFNNAHCRNWIYHLLYDNSYQKKMYDYGSNCLWKQARLDLYPEAIALLKNENPDKHGRAWYRHIDYYVNTFEHVSMRNFNQRWFRILRICEDIHAMNVKIPFYMVGDLMLELIKKGYSSSTQIESCYEKYAGRLGILTDMLTNYGSNDAANIQKRLCNANDKISRIIKCNYIIEGLAFRIQDTKKQVYLSLFNYINSDPNLALDYYADMNIRYQRRYPIYKDIIVNNSVCFLKGIFLKLLSLSFSTIDAEWISPFRTKLPLA